MLCEFKRLIYPKSVLADDTGYRIALYRPCEAVKDAAGKPVSEVKAVGYCLPTGERQRFDLRGHWSRDSKYGVQFEVEDYQQVIVPTKEGILAYLSSGQIKGIGPKTAEKIYHAFGNDTLKILDEEPHRLLEVKGISQTKLQRIRDSYLASRGARDVVAFLAPHGVSPNRAVKLYREFGKDTLDILKNHPYRLCELAGIGFRTADKIAQSLGLDPRSPERVDAALLHTLQEAEQRGHLCLDKREFLKLTLKLLDTPGLTELMAAARASRLEEERKLVSCHKWVYRWPTAQAEVKLARQVSSMLSFNQKEQGDGLSQKLTQIEGKLGLSQRGTAQGGAHRPREPHHYPHRRARYGQNHDPKGSARPLPGDTPRREDHLLRPHRPGRPEDGGVHRCGGLHHPQGAKAHGRGGRGLRPAGTPGCGPGLGG